MEMEQTEERAYCEYCGVTTDIDTNDMGEMVCLSCALGHHVSETAAYVTPGYSAEDGYASLWVVLTGDEFVPNGSEMQSRQLTIAEMQHFIKDAQEALQSAIEMEQRYAKDGE
jgi:hypothetical protein